MEYHLKFNALADYVESFAKEICDAFFGNKSKVSGQELVKLTPSAQINAFLVKAIFEEWQSEATNLESPFFDYSSPEVKEKMSELMKTLSSHISIDRESLEPMLAQAAFDTFVAQFNPKQYFRGLFAPLSGDVSVDKDLKHLFKYIKCHLKFVEKVYKAFLAEGMVLDASRLNKVVSRVAKNETLLDDRDTVEENLKPIQQVLNFKIKELVSDWETEKVEMASRGILTPLLPVDHPAFEEENEPAEEIDKSFIDKTRHYAEEDYIPENIEDAMLNEEDLLSEEEIVGEQERPLTEADLTGQPVDEDDSELGFTTPIAPAQPTLDDDVTANLLTGEPDITEEDLEEAVENPNVERAEVPEFIEEGTPPPSDDDEEEEGEENPSANIFETEESGSDDNSEPETLLEKLGGSTDSGDSLINQIAANENQSISQLRGSIPLNLKFKFQNELFGGNNEDFNKAIDMVDECKDYHTAIALLKEKYIRKYNWDLGDETTRDFLSLVDKKFD